MYINSKKRMDYNFRCDCPFTSALDVIGDKWILVIIKQMLIEHKQTFKSFVESDEAIATNILSTKLKWLEDFGIVLKTKLPTNKKSNIYLLTEKGLALTPLIVELGLWSDQYLREFHPTLVDGVSMNILRKDKVQFTKNVEQSYRDMLAAINIVTNG